MHAMSIKVLKLNTYTTWENILIGLNDSLWKIIYVYNLVLN